VLAAALSLVETQITQTNVAQPRRWCRVTYSTIQ